jgi:hypothetical protein
MNLSPPAGFNELILVLRRGFLFSLLTAALLAALTVVVGNWILSSPRNSSDTGRDSSVSSGSFRVSKSRSRTLATRRAVEDAWDLRWQQLTAAVQTASRDEEMAAFLEELAAVDPLRAIELARNQTDSELRDPLLEAALRGWGRGAQNPEDAIAWARSQTLMDEGQAMASIFHGAANDPEKALRLARQLSEQEPERAGDFGAYLVAALGRVKEFDKAAGFAANAPAEVRVDLLNAACSRWADSDPKAALKYLADSSDPNVQPTAFAAVMSHWAKKDSPAAAEYALTLPEGNDRNLALTMSLRNWAATDGPAAAAWIMRFDPSSELDFGAAILASSPDTLVHPEVATSWAESIVDSRLRVRVLAAVVKEWAAVDPVAAQHYAWSSPGIRTEDRRGVLSAFEPDFQPISILP